MYVYVYGLKESEHSKHFSLNSTVVDDCHLPQSYKRPFVKKQQQIDKNTPPEPKEYLIYDEV